MLRREIYVQFAIQIPDMRFINISTLSLVAHQSRTGTV